MTPPPHLTRAALGAGLVGVAAALGPLSGSAVLGIIAASLAAGVLLARSAPVTVVKPPQPPAPPAQDIARLRHDLRGILSPAMLVADRLAGHADPTVQRAGEIVVGAIEKAADRISATRVASATTDQRPSV